MKSHVAVALLVSLFCLPPPVRADLHYPVNGVLTSGVGWRLDPFGTGKLFYHRGVDIAVPVGTPVLATRNGKVVFAGERGGYGWAVILEHHDGDRTLYGHNSRLKVKEGETVEAGTVVALSGNTGRSTAPHVHYELIPRAGDVRLEEPAREVPAESAGLADNRLLLERKMKESLDSVLRTIRSGTPGG